MVLLFSRADDGNTHTVVEWLLHFKKPFIRINADDRKTKIKYIDSITDKIIVEQNGRDFDLSDCSSIWYRRRGISVNSTGIETGLPAIFPDSPSYHETHLEKETSSLAYFMYSQLGKRVQNIIGSPYNMNVNKLRVLEMAKGFGLSIPKSYVLTSKKDLKKLLIEEKLALITKALSDGVYLFTDHNAYYSYTEKINEEDLHKIPDSFYPSLFQVQIKKKLELRVFFVNGRFYAMAIFSQNDKQTTVDFRKYNNTVPNRTVPYNLPKNIEDKLKGLMKELKLNTGSIDLIIDEQNDYVFLEVNPVGQITMTSKPCNYYLEKKIAEIL